MARHPAFARLAFALILVVATGNLAEAQSTISSDAIRAANDAAGTATVFASRIAAGDSLIISIEDAQLTAETLMAAAWRFGGHEETPRAVGRSIAEAIRSGLPAESPVKTIVVEVVGPRAVFGEDTPLPPGGARLRFPYPIDGRADARSAISSEVINAAQAAAGTAIVLEARIFAGDSVVVAIEDPQLSSGTLGAGPWRLGGRDESPREVGRAIAQAIRAALPAESMVKLIVVNVVGPSPAPVENSGFSYRARGIAVRFPYSFAGASPR